MIFRNHSEIIEESLDVTNEDIKLRKHEIHQLNSKYKEEIEDMRSILSYTKQNQSRVLDSLWAKVPSY